MKYLIALAYLFSFSAFAGSGIQGVTVFCESEKKGGIYFYDLDSVNRRVLSSPMGIRVTDPNTKQPANLWMRAELLSSGDDLLQQANAINFQISMNAFTEDRADEGYFHHYTPLEVSDVRLNVKDIRAGGKWSKTFSGPGYKVACHGTASLSPLYTTGRTQLLELGRPAPLAALDHSRLLFHWNPSALGSAVPCALAVRSNLADVKEQVRLLRRIHATQSIGDGFSNRIAAFFSDDRIVPPFRENFSGHTPQLRFNLMPGQKYLLLESGLQEDGSRKPLEKAFTGQLSSLEAELLGCEK